MKVLGLVIVLTLMTITGRAGDLTCAINLPNPSADKTIVVRGKFDKASGRYKASYTYTNDAIKGQEKTYDITSEIWRGLASGSAQETTMGYLMISQTGVPNTNQAINHCAGDVCKTELVVTLNGVGMQAQCEYK